MSTGIGPRSRPAVVYPESDGRPMSDNTLQFQWIVTIKEGLEALYADRPDVFVAGDLLWYPVEGDPRTRIAPDAMVALGRPKGHRGSYRQWEEGGVAPAVVFEVISPGNTAEEMARKRAFYERHGVLEFYLYDPETGALEGWSRGEAAAPLAAIPAMDGWTSPALGIRFERPGGALSLIRPDGRPFQTYLELYRTGRRLEAERDAERARADRLAERLRALGLDPDA